MSGFSATGLRSELLEAVKELGFVDPTPIQQQTIPHLLNSDQDLIALAQTGTGKTAAFGLPAIHNTSLDNPDIQTLVLCPTRELCLQITRDLESYCKLLPQLKTVAIYGGASVEGQARALKKGAHIVVGTPGRTVDMIKRRKLFLGNVQLLVLDEADEMLTMGFKEDLDFILDQTPEEKQTALFSATMSREIIRITKTYMNDPEQMSAAPMNKGADTVRHVYFQVQARDRYEVLKRIADVSRNIYGIVFCRTRNETRDVARKLMSDGYNADAIHGDLSQAQRDEVMNRFRSRQLQMLVATDVAARGLDVNDLTHVINYNLPDAAETYTHRSGRTGRAGKKGVSMAIIHSRERRRLTEIERRSGIKFERKLVPTGELICQKQLMAMIDQMEKVEVNEAQIAPFMPVIYEKLEGLSKEEVIKRFVSEEFNRFLNYYKDARDINLPDKSDRRDKKNDRKAPDEGQPKNRAERRAERNKKDWTRLHINLGSKNKLTPQRLMGIVNEGLDNNTASIGKIEIMRNFSFFEIETGREKELIEAVKEIEFDGMSVTLEVAQPRPEGGDTVREKKDRKSGYRKKRKGKKFEKKRKREAKFGRKKKRK